MEAVIFASAEPVSGETLARVVGRDGSIDLLIDDLIEELRDRRMNLCRLPAAGNVAPDRGSPTRFVPRRRRPAEALRRCRS